MSALKMLALHSPDAADVSVWVTEFSQRCNPGPCATGSSHPVSLYFLVHPQTSSEPGKRGSLHSFQNDPKEILYRESLCKGRRWRKNIWFQNIRIINWLNYCNHHRNSFSITQKSLSQWLFALGGAITIHSHQRIIPFIHSLRLNPSLCALLPTDWINFPLWEPECKQNTLGRAKMWNNYASFSF